jgi:uroporphyrinogen-III synthase|tara:strand:- start:2678 stop:3394 length:717 start_codon:yes stop_codon:yes gene_type:complete
VANNAKHPQINLLLTRPMAASHTFWEALNSETRQLLQPIVSPLIKINPITSGLEISGSVIFSSVNGALNGPAGDGRIAYCVGAMTTQAALTAGWAAIQAGETANQLVLNLLNRKVGVSLTHLSGVHTRGNIAEILSAGGVSTKRIVVYDQEVCALTSQATEALSVNFPLLVPLFSPRTARSFADQNNGQAALHIIALSQDVADQVSDLTLETLTVLDHPTRLAMIDETQKVASDLTLG